MKRHSTKHLLASIMTGLFCAAGTASAALWTGLGADNEYSTPGNWDDSLVPASNSTQDITGAFTVERSVDSTAGRTFVSGGGTLNVTGGSHSDNRSGNTIRNFVGRGSAGTVNQTDGSYDIGHMLSIGGGGAGGNGAFYLSGGSLVVSRGSNSIIDDSNPHGGASIEVSDEENAGSGLFEISGGSLTTRIGVGVGTTGTFSVVGSGATLIGIGSNNTLDGSWLQQSGGTLSAAIDLGGVTPILIDDVDGGGALAEFKDGAILDLGFASGVTAFGGSWTLMEVENSAIIDLGLELSAATLADPGWSFAVDNSGVNGLITATYVIPEPSVLAALFGLFGLGITLIRRRR